MLKIRRFRDHLIFNMGITYMGKTVFKLRRGPGAIEWLSHYQWSNPLRERKLSVTTTTNPAQSTVFLRITVWSTYTSVPKNVGYKPPWFDLPIYIGKALAVIFISNSACVLRWRLLTSTQCLNAEWIRFVANGMMICRQLVKKSDIHSPIWKHCAGNRKKIRPGKIFMNREIGYAHE